MSQYSTSVLNGKIDAISLVLNQVLMTLTPVQAAQAAMTLAIEKEALRTEADGDMPEEEIAVKEQLLGAYAELLSAVSRNA